MNFDDACKRIIENVKRPLPYFVVDVKMAYLHYATRMNWRNPQKKTSWKRLGRRQRQMAIINEILTPFPALVDTSHNDHTD